MAMKYKPYPAYKDSGVEWLGEAPAGWEVKPIKYVSTCNNEVLSESTESHYEIEYVDISSVDEVHGITSTQKMIFSNAPSRARRIVRDGDIIVSTVRTYLRAITSIHNPSNNLIVSTGFAVIRPSVMLNVHFAHYLFKASYLVDEVIARSVGVSYPAINSSELIAIKIGLPSLDEQSAIATFLDRETTQIDTLIAKQEHLIELLQEKRTALISHAVTKGLNPDVPMKNSGVEWLGEAPGHWEVKRLRFVAYLNPSRSETAAIDRDTEVSFLPMEAIGDDGSLNFERTRPVGEVESGYTYFREGDVTIAKITPCFENGKGAIMRGLWGGIGFGTTELIVVRPQVTKTTSVYLHWLFLSTPFRKLGESSMYGAGGQKRVPDDFIRNFTAAFPTLSEQQAIAVFLDCETAKIDTLIQKARQAIDLLKERRTALISAAVTGKIDVRDRI